jgi:uncharacterized protein YeaO (DUF488 family)
MAIRVVRLGSERFPDEGLRIGTVRRPPRGVPKKEFASRNFYDIWLPILSPTPATVKLGLDARTDREWAKFIGNFAGDEGRPGATLNLLAALSHHATSRSVVTAKTKPLSPIRASRIAARTRRQHEVNTPWRN